MTGHTLVHQLAHWAEHKPNEYALTHRVGGGWKKRSWRTFYDEVRSAAKALIALGHEVGDCVAIVGDNRPEWLVLELAIMAARGVPAPIYTTNTPEQMAYIVDNSRAKIAICDGLEQYRKFRRAAADGLMEVERILTMDALDVEETDVVSFDQLLALGAEQDDAELDARIDTITDDETALLIYTSGTTGKPKGVMLEHGGMVEVARALVERLPRFASGEIPYRAISYLPLCHAAEQLVTTMGLLATGGEVHFCEDIGEIKQVLTDVRPTVFLGVPRIWEKFEAALTAGFARQSPRIVKLLGWARDLQLQAMRRQAETGRPSRSLVRSVVNRVVRRLVLRAVGMDQIYVAVTGSAPISVGTLEFFASLGLPIVEAYGMSETTGVCTIGDVDRPRPGKVGRALDGVGIRIAADGEVQLSGRIMTRGYLHMPDATAELYTDDGWLCTGDLGELDDEGYLSITGRKKELLITAGGKNVAPVEMESYMQQIHGVDKAIVVGDRQPYLCALVTIDVEALDELAARFSTDASLGALADSPAFAEYLEQQVEEQCNQKVARYQTIKKLHVLPTEFTVEGGELTPTMKIRRNVITDKYSAEIAAFYEGVPQQS